jgi:hypothetical protein
VDVPSLQELQLRIRQALSYALTQKLTNPQSHFFSTDSGLVWKSAIAPDCQVQENAMVNYEEAYIRAWSQFPAHLSSILKDQYLDLHAGVAVASTPPEVVAKFRKMMDQAPLSHIQGIDLKLRKGSESKIGESECNEGAIESPLAGYEQLLCAWVDWSIIEGLLLHSKGTFHRGHHYHCEVGLAVGEHECIQIHPQLAEQCPQKMEKEHQVESHPKEQAHIGCHALEIQMYLTPHPPHLDL